MVAITLNGNQYSSDGSATRDMLNGGHRTWLLPMLQDATAEVAHKATLTAGDLVQVQALATTATSTATTLGSAQCGVMLPLYLYPNNPFTDAVMLDLLDIIRAYRSVPTICVVNPANGPGTVEDGNYSALIKALKGAGARVLGYVQTNYAGTIAPNHTEAQVKADISSWLTVYSNSLIQGIFLDEMNYDTGPGNVGSDYVDLYVRYTTYCHELNLYPVVGNPGTNQQQAWFASPTSDIIVVHETGTLPVDSDMHGNTVGGHVQYPPRMRAVLAYGQSALDEHKLRKTRRYVNWLYYDADTLPNPWNTLPSYLRQLYAALADTGALGEGTQFLTSGSAVAWDCGEVAAASFTIAHSTATMSAPTNLLPGRKYRLLVTQDATGGRNLAFNAAYKFPSGTPLPITGTAGKKHVIEFMSDGTSLYALSVNTFT